MTARPAVGIDVGGTTLKAAVVEGEQVRVARRIDLGGGDPLAVAAATAAELVAAHRPAAVGLGVAGLVRHLEGVFVWGPHLPGREVPLRRQLVERLGLPVTVDNDANCAAFAEHRAGAAVGARDAVVLTVGTGIGAGLVVGGRVRRGAGFAGEVGHMRMATGVPRPCACGREGCWETLVSGEVLDREALRLAAAGRAVREAAGGDEPRARHLVDAARDGDDEAAAVLAEAGHWLGVGIAQLCLILDPEVVVVAGGLAAAGDMLLEPARRVLASRLPGDGARRPARVLPARFGRLAGAVGAALLAETERAAAGSRRRIEDGWTGDSSQTR